MAIPQMRKRTQMVETEMGRMVPKADQEKFEKKAGEALDKAVSSPYKMAMAERAEKMKAKAAREIVFKKGREAVKTPSNEYKYTRSMEPMGDIKSIRTLNEKKSGILKSKEITPQTDRDTSFKHAYNTTEDSTWHYLDVMQKEMGKIGREKFYKAQANLKRQSKKGEDGYDKNGNPEFTPFFKKGEENAKYGYKNK